MQVSPTMQFYYANYTEKCRLLTSIHIVNIFAVAHFCIFQTSKGVLKGAKQVDMLITSVT